MAKKPNTSKNILLALIGILLITITVLSLAIISADEKQSFFNHLLPKATHRIVLTENGFSPAEITIHTGDTVIFSTSRNQQFWPASNLHPTHDIYPAFDPQQPINPKNDWSFTFNRPGSWKYHDHLAPSFTGVIIVGDSRQSSEKYSTDCKSLNGPHKLQCWEHEIEITLAQEGLQAAFLRLENFYNTDADFATDCHGLAHSLGQHAYMRYKTESSLILTDNASYCGYGFYHGYMETLLTKTGDVRQLTAFCENVAKNQSRILSDACYHGIGHGAFTDSLEKSTKAVQEHVQNSLSFCKKVSLNELSYSRCTSGLFMELATSLMDGKFRLDNKDPLLPCRQQKTRDKMSCYTQFNALINRVTQNNITQAAELITTITDRNIAIETMITTAANRYMSERKHTDSINECRHIVEYLHLPCIQGIALSILLTGKDQEAATKTISFCNTATLDYTEKEACAQLTTQHLQNLYAKDLFQSYCYDLNKEFYYLCS